MDPTTAVRTDTLPAIATVMAPGAFASAPYVYLCLSSFPNVLTFLREHEAIALSAALILWIVCGFAIDSVGTYVEVYWIDRRREDHEEMLRTWWQYLRIAWVREPIGQHYLRRLLVSFKFELNMYVAAMASFFGVATLGFAGTLGWPLAMGVVISLGAAAIFFAKAARDTSEVLANVRAALVKGVGEPPFDQGDNPKRGLV